MPAEVAAPPPQPTCYPRSTRSSRCKRNPRFCRAMFGAPKREKWMWKTPDQSVSEGHANVCSSG